MNNIKVKTNLVCDNQVQKPLINVNNDSTFSIVHYI